MIARLVLMGVLTGVAVANAQDFSFNPNASEMLRMPLYCKVKFTAPQRSPEWQMWFERMGPNFHDIHHYCAGLNYVNRYWGARSSRDRSYYLRRAMDNFTYMVKAEKPGFPLRAEVYANRGEVFKLQGKPGEAVRDFRHAIELDPKLTKPYLQLIDLYEGRKHRAEALEVATLGVRHNPDSRALQRRYLEVGGKKPFPEPVDAKVAEPSQQAKPEAAPTPQSVAAPIPAAAVTPESAASAEAVSPPPPIGTLKNPYCRFCPPE